MYSYLIGTVTEIESNYITLEVNKVGYLIYTGNPYKFEIGKEYKVYIYQLVKEDEESLYGFKTLEEKELFLKLISVKGLGCKMALPMIAGDNIGGITDAIERENILYLKKFPKIGDKVARQIILDLKGKLCVTTSTVVETNNELVEVLKELGYKAPDIKKILPSIDNTKEMQDQIKDALRLLLK
ncbi:MAG: Holliday junction branch migration protein RuvA [Bacilli bacterium]|nr:Holliday junction branch migration protein RuvA [Bacilli bacterium]